MSFSRNLKEITEKSLDRVKHRGPDGRGIVLGLNATLLHDNCDGDSNWALGHTRLAILDLTSSGAQPMCDQDRMYWITFNGEIYNYLELRSELQAAGYVFRSSSDTEVIIAAYSRWGHASLQRFNGMFAFILVDLFRGQVFAARDRFGVKPLYVWQNQTMILFVSEIKQLFDVPGFSPRLNKQQAMDFLVDGISGHEPDACLFDHVVPFKPGYFLAWQLGQTPSLNSITCYWKPRLIQRLVTKETAVEEFGAIFRDAIRIRLRSDVPVGSCLSGGLDSSSIAVLVAREFKHPLATFSFCSETAEFDESYYIDVVNKVCNTDAHKVFATEENAIKDLDKLLYQQDEPFGGLSIYAQNIVMKAARQAGVPVLLDGQGGDEILCGYKKFAIFRLQSLINQRQFIEALRYIYFLTRYGDKKLLDLGSGGKYLPSMLMRFYGKISKIVRPEWQSLVRRTWHDFTKSRKDIHYHQMQDIVKWSLPVLLRYEDRNSMAYSIETRLPFLDYRLVEYCLSIPENLFFDLGRSKRILLDSCKSHMPQEIKDRRTKMGFELPDRLWMKGNFGRYLEDRVRASELLGEILDRKMLIEMFAKFRKGQLAQHHRVLERIGIFALWLDKFKIEI